MSKYKLGYDFSDEDEEAINNAIKDSKDYMESHTISRSLPIVDIRYYDNIRPSIGYGAESTPMSGRKQRKDKGLPRKNKNKPKKR